MSTACLIATLYDTGQVEAIYCHSSGAPIHTGRTLMEHYTEPSKVEALLALGSISILRQEIGRKHRIWASQDYQYNPDAKYKHHIAIWNGRNNVWFPHKERYQRKLETWTEAYKRDRGDTDSEFNTPRIYANPGDLLEHARQADWGDPEYVYLYDHGRWWCTDSKMKRFINLGAAAARDVRKYIPEAQASWAEAAQQLIKDEAERYYSPTRQKTNGRTKDSAPAA